jgi:tetratricopeptide (TPR) repeat protein
MATGAELQKQGVDLFMQHDYEAAAEKFKAAVTAYDQEGKADLAAEMKVNLGLVDRALGNFDNAVALMSEAQQVFAKLNDPSREAQVKGNLGGVYLSQGNNEQAMTLYREAADAFKELNDADRYGQTLLAVADIQFKTGKLMEAAATYEVALDSIKDLTFRQRIMRGLLDVKNKLSGTGVPKA